MTGGITILAYDKNDDPLEIVLYPDGTMSFPDNEELECDIIAAELGDEPSYIALLYENYQKYGILYFAISEKRYCDDDEFLDEFMDLTNENKKLWSRNVCEHFEAFTDNILYKYGSRDNSDTIRYMLGYLTDDIELKQLDGYLESEQGEPGENYYAGGGCTIELFINKIKCFEFDVWAWGSYHGSPDYRDWITTLDDHQDFNHLDEIFDISRVGIELPEPSDCDEYEIFENHENGRYALVVTEYDTIEFVKTYDTGEQLDKAENFIRKWFKFDFDSPEFNLFHLTDEKHIPFYAYLEKGENYDDFNLLVPDGWEQL